MKVAGRSPIIMRWLACFGLATKTEWAPLKLCICNLICLESFQGLVGLRLYLGLLKNRKWMMLSDLCLPTRLLGLMALMVIFLRNVGLLFKMSFISWLRIFIRRSSVWKISMDLLLP